MNSHVRTLMVMLYGVAATWAGDLIGYEEAVRRAMGNDPQLAATRGALQDHAGDGTAVSLGDPEVATLTENLGADELELVLSVPVKLGGTRRARASHARAARLEQQARRIAVRADVIRRYALVLSLALICRQLEAAVAAQEGDLQRIASHVQSDAVM
ncbi:MAG: hypothetical protein GF331_14095, partial [Chitinivibrionales bacterium]|nr:hypothetical protein [Chitinivibrionales bacterium]